MKSFPLPFWRSTEVRVDQLKNSAELTNSVTATAAVKKKTGERAWAAAMSEAECAAQERWSPKEHYGPR